MNEIAYLNTKLYDKGKFEMKASGETSDILNIISGVLVEICKVTDNDLDYCLDYLKIQSEHLLKQENTEANLKQ